MSKHYLSFVSLTYVYKAREILKRHGIASRVIPTPKSVGRAGCSYSLVPSGDSLEAAQILKNAGIRVIHVQ